MTNSQVILFVAFQTSRNSNGGVESATRIFEALARDFEWVLLTNRETDRSRRWAARGARVEYVGLADAGPGWRRALALGLLFWRALIFARGLRPDVIHANDILAARTMLPISRILQTPLIFTIRGTKPDGAHYGKQWSCVVHRAARVITLSNEMSRTISQRLTIGADRLQTIHSIVDLEAFSPLPRHAREIARRRFGITDGEVAIGLIGAVAPLKGQLEFLRQAMPIISGGCSSARAHLIGDYFPAAEAYAGDCNDTVRALNLAQRVTFHGYTRQVHVFLQAVDIVVVASQYEGLARAMIEAMACGVPVVSFAVCSAREMLEQTGAGIVVSQGDYSGMAAAVIDLCRNVERRGELGKLGRLAAERRFGEAPVAEAWRNVYSHTTVGDVGAPAR